MKALISPNDPKADDDGTIIGIRVLETNPTGFEVAPPLFWIECEDNIDPGECYYDTNSETIKTVPGYPKQLPKPITPIEEYTEL